MRAYITLAIFISVAIASYWLRQDITDTADNDKQTDTRFPDYFMENFTITSMNNNGQPEIILNAKKMLHYADDNSAELEQPVLKINQTDNNITFQSSRATYLKQDNIIHLYDNVIIHRAATKNQLELSIYTDYLKMNTVTRIAETSLATRVKTPEAELTSIGMKLNGLQGTLKLQSKVKGIYEAAN
jgi:lipopolysaccharide export system protein LptC